MKLLLIVVICILSNSTSACEDKVLGSMDPAEIRKILLHHLPEFKTCHQNEAAKGFEGKGYMSLHFFIQEHGNVTDPEVSSETYFPDDIKRCLVSVMEGMRFPAPIGGGKVEVRQPIYFYSHNN